MKITKAEYLRKFKGVNNYRGTDKLVLVEIPDPIDSPEQSKKSERKTQAVKRSN